MATYGRWNLFHLTLSCRQNSNTEPRHGGPPRLKRGSADDAKESEAPGEIPLDPFAYLQEALRLPATGEKQVQGVLLRLDCDAKGIFFVVQLADRVIKLRTSKFENIQITAFTSDAGAEITCGPTSAMTHGSSVAT